MITFTKVALPYGWLGNMSPHPIQYQGREWRTSEALFQALRFAPEDIIRDEIRSMVSPMSAKMVAKHYREKMVVVPQGPEDLNNMRRCLVLKASQWPVIEQDLLDTKDELLVEDCTRRPRGSGPFWGMVQMPDGVWKGENVLGRLWMEVRDFYRSRRLQANLNEERDDREREERNLEGIMARASKEVAAWPDWKRSADIKEELKK